MRWMLLNALLLVLLGCAPHVAHLSDTRINGVPVSYQGNTPPGRLAVARRQLTLTDVEDDLQRWLRSLEEQIREEGTKPVPDPGVLQRLRELHDRVSERLASLRGELTAPQPAGQGLAHGIVFNRRGEPRLVSITDRSGTPASPPFILEPGESREVSLEPGDAYRFTYTPLGSGRTYERQQTRALEEGEPWIAGVH